MFKRRVKVYEGPVLFDGVHHFPAGPDGHRKGRRPVIRTFAPDGTQGWRYGSRREPGHNHVHERNVVELPVEERAQW